MDSNAHHPEINNPNSNQNNISDQTGRHIIESLSSSPNLILVQSNTATHVRGSLDLVFVSSFLRNHINTTIHQHLSSDHYTLISEFSLPRLASPPYSPKWKTVNANWNTYQDHITNWALNYDNSGQTIDELEEDLRTVITRAAEITFSKTKPHNRNHSDHWYYNERVAELHHRIHITRKNLHKHPSEINSPI